MVTKHAQFSVFPGFELRERRASAAAGWGSQRRLFKQSIVTGSTRSVFGYSEILTGEQQEKRDGWFKCLAMVMETCQGQRKSRAPHPPKLSLGLRSPLCMEQGAVLEEIQEPGAGGSPDPLDQSLLYFVSPG